MNFYEKYDNSRLFCDGWEFCKTPLGSEYSEELSFQRVDIPHDWLIENTNDLYETSTGWYRKRFTYRKKDGVRTYIRFDGVYMDSRVIVNGKMAGEWKYGYSAFQFDITELILDGKNEILVCVNHQAPNSRWYSGAGIYRKVWLCETPQIRFGNDGIYIHASAPQNVPNTLDASQNSLNTSDAPQNLPNTSDTLKNSWNVSVTSEILQNAGNSFSDIRVRQTILDRENAVISTCESDACAADISCIPKASRVENAVYSLTTQNLKVPDPCLWDIENPYLYTMVSEILAGGEVIQRVSRHFGLRTMEFTTEQGFFLNGRHVKLHGSCEHHDHGCLGAAFNIAALRRRFKKLREMGVNAIRTSHNMPAQEMMELADESGMLILSEGFDMWERSKTDYDYARFFDAWVEKDVASWIRRDRNHPSVIGWSIGNEIYDTHADERGQEVTSLLKHLVEQHDPKGNAAVTFGSNFMQWENGQKCGDILKLVGYNYGERLYEEHHKKHPDWMIYGSETASVVQSRGIYHFPLEETLLTDDDEQCSSLGNSCTGWGAKNTEECIIKDRDAQFCAGQFIWTGFDYIGEPTPYSTKNSYFGQYDTAGFAKDSAYVFRAEWTDYHKAPFVHIFPYWDFNEGLPVDVRVCSNAPKIELFYNGDSLGSCEIDHAHGKQLTGNYKISYGKGELKALAYDENGQVIAEDVKCSFGDAARLMIEPDKTEVLADGEDLIYLEISALDENGVFCANANNRVNVCVDGEGRLMGLDNGDSTDYDQYKGTSRRLFSGKLLAVIASSGKEGKITVTITSPGLPDQHMELHSVNAPEGMKKTCIQRVCFAQTECGRMDEIPVRKIELNADCLQLSEKISETTVSYTVYPKNADYREELEFLVTNEKGIKTNLAECTVNSDHTVTIKANGDGTFWLRAMCKNGTSRYHIISVLQFTATGIGHALTNPYEFIIGGLYTRASENISSGMNRGVGFATGGASSWAAYDDIDFGSTGTDTVTVSIWANTQDPVHIRFYEGIPGENGELLGEFTYHKKPEWMVFKEDTFRLQKKLRGIHTFCIETTDGFQVSGFTFEKVQREFAKNHAADAENIYGDKFATEKTNVTGIGNNVMLDFGEFDFSERQPQKIIICGKSPLELNSIHLILNGADGEKRILCEFRMDRAADYEERTFELEEVTGKQKVSFAFLPGSNFDFAYFRFV